jgi:hypothetical protein
LQRVVDIVNGDAQRLRFTLIDIDLQLRAVVEAVMANAGQPLFAGQLKQRIAGRHQRIVPVAGVILKLHIEAGRTAPLIAGGLLAKTRFVNLIKRFGGAFNDGKGGAGFGSRSSQSFRRTNIRATFCPLPPGPEPTVANTDSTFCFSLLRK